MPQLGCVVQIAYAVPDVRTAARHYAQTLGAGPFFVRRHDPLRSATHRGEPVAFDHSSAYGQWGQVQLELVQIHEAAPEVVAGAVMATSGIHHMATFVASLDAEQERLERLGWPSVLDAVTAGGFRFAFHDARNELGHLLEVYEPLDGVLALYGMVAAAADGWDGDDPVREW